ncbi:MAG: hypothetical protein U0M12_04035 [Acutalibacteraceae bacterium]|nr:hypothetical protein [Acutalibacteraceae bacterium]
MNDNSKNQYEKSLYTAQEYAERITEVYEVDKRRYINPLNEAERLKR